MTIGMLPISIKARGYVYLIFMCIVFVHLACDERNMVAGNQNAQNAVLYIINAFSVLSLLNKIMGAPQKYQIQLFSQILDQILSIWHNFVVYFT